MSGASFRIILLLLLVTLTGLLCLSVGAVRVPLRDLGSALLGSAPNEEASLYSTIIWNLRLRRVLLAAVIGFGLGASGAAYQGLFRNPLADPFIIGASSGAALGAVVAIQWSAAFVVVSSSAVPLAALVGAMLTVLVVYQLAEWGGQTATVSLLLAGTAVSSFLGSIVALLMFWNAESLVTTYGWLLGTTSGRGWETLFTITPLVLIGGLVLWLYSRVLDSLTFGEETAAALGVRLMSSRRIIVVGASLATAASVAGAGVVGFVGLIAPHVARFVVGARHGMLIPASAVIGAILVLVADASARSLAAPAELPLGVVTALFGAPFFLYVLRTNSAAIGAVS